MLEVDGAEAVSMTEDGDLRVRLDKADEVVRPSWDYEVNILIEC